MELFEKAENMEAGYWMYLAMKFKGGRIRDRN